MIRTIAWLMFMTGSAALGCGCALPSSSPAGSGAARAVHHPPPPLPPPSEGDPSAIAAEPPPPPPELSGPQPVETYIRVALDRNRAVQAALLDVLAMKQRVPQATALDDPMALSTIWPFPDNGPQYSLMGYGPYGLMITQEFPWLGTLRLRGEVAEQEVRAALAELAAARLEVIAQVKRAYATLAADQRAEEILLANRALAEDLVAIAAARYRTGSTSQQDVLRAENAVVELDTELAEVRRGLAESRAALARLLHVGPEVPLRALPPSPTAGLTTRLDALYRLAAAARPELHGQLAEVARRSREAELARKRSFPDIALGVSYMTMSRAGAMSPIADGRDNVGLVVGLNLPIYRARIEAGIREAEARTLAEARRYESLRDETFESIAERFAEVKARREMLDLIRGSFLPRSRLALEVALSDYRGGTLDFVSLITAWREVLQVELQAVRIEAELLRAIAALERVVGVRLSASAPLAGPETPTADEIPAPPPAGAASPFREGPRPLDDRRAPARRTAPGRSVVPPGAPSPLSDAKRPAPLDQSSETVTVFNSM